MGRSQDERFEKGGNADCETDRLHTHRNGRLQEDNKSFGVANTTKPVHDTTRNPYATLRRCYPNTIMLRLEFNHTASYENELSFVVLVKGEVPVFWHVLKISCRHSSIIVMRILCVKICYDHRHGKAPFI